ncbi:MAG: cupin domain-containing protein [Candidatus Macondimonas sp.]
MKQVVSDDGAVPPAEIMPCTASGQSEDGRPVRGNLWAALPPPGGEEQVQILLSQPGIRLERIVSHGQASPPGFWYDQEEGEFVVLLAGAATLSLQIADGVYETVALRPGDWLHLPAHCRHRVEATAEGQPTVWLAVFFPAAVSEASGTAA